MKRIWMVLTAISLCACSNTVTGPSATKSVRGPDCTDVIKIVHGDSVFTITAYYSDTTAYCRSLKKP